jgi:hypothetical protein
MNLEQRIKELEEGEVAWRKALYEAEWRHNRLRHAATLLVEACERMGDRGVDESAPRLRALLKEKP